MEQLVNGQYGTEASISPIRTERPSSSNEARWEALQRMAEAGAFAISLVDGLVTVVRSSWERYPSLSSMGSAEGRLESGRAIAESMSNRPLVMACTSARQARSLTDAQDSRDHRHLTGNRTAEGLHVYCGSMDAAIRRSLTYAAFADVLCYRVASLDLMEARAFASEIHAAFPEKTLGIGFSVELGADVMRQVKRLADMGYGYSFFIFGDSVVFPKFPHSSPWVLFDDSEEMDHPCVDDTNTQIAGLTSALSSNGPSSSPYRLQC